MAYPEDISEEEWEARRNAEILADAEAIKADKDKLAKARKAAKKMMPEMEDRAKAQTARARAMKRLGKKV